MKVIFLDFDGVMCLADQWGGRAKKMIKIIAIKVVVAETKKRSILIV